MTMTRTEFNARLTQGLLFLAAFMVPAIFRGREFGSTAVDFQIFFKLAVFGGAFAYAIYYYREWIGRLGKIDGIFCAGLLGWILVTCLYAPSPVYSLAAAFTCIALIAFLYLVAARLDIATVIRTIIYACTLIAAISLVVYFVNPSFGRGGEWIDGVQQPGNRITGITGTANIMGNVSAFCCLLIIIYRMYLGRLPAIFYGFLALNFLVQIMSGSRSSLLAMFIAIGIAVLYRATPTKLALLFSGICAVSLFLVSVDVEALLAALSRSGDAQEILTGTGRTEIWAQVIDMIKVHPIIGWGYGSSGYLMMQFPRYPSPHAHSMVLQFLATIGFIGLFFALAALATKIYYAIKADDQFKIALLGFLLIHGLTESSALAGVVTIPTLVFGLIMALPYIRTIPPAGSPPEKNRELRPRFSGGSV